MRVTFCREINIPATNTVCKPTVTNATNGIGQNEPQKTILSHYDQWLITGSNWFSFCFPSFIAHWRYGVMMSMKLRTELSQLTTIILYYLIQILC
jgi:hypothetical protein